MSKVRLGSMSSKANESMTITRPLRRKGRQGVQSKSVRQNLLIGNGVNLCSDTGCEFFSQTAIKQRFLTVLESSLLEIPFENLRIGIRNAIRLLQESSDANIEELAALVFDVVRRVETLKNGFFGDNDNQRLKRILKKAAINSIFIDKGQFKKIDIWEKTRLSISKYNNIFSLNYYEYWDIENRAVFLHNKIEREEGTSNIKNAEQCIFSPLRELPKSQVDALYPSDHLYPANDLVLSVIHELYGPLEGIECIDVFGVSPFGDAELLNYIKKISKKRIFIYEIDKNNKEVDAWIQGVGDADYFDAHEFYCD